MRCANLLDTFSDLLDEIVRLLVKLTQILAKHPHLLANSLDEPNELMLLLSRIKDNI